MSTSLQKAIVMELLNVTKAEEGQKKMIFGRPFHYAGSKWVPDKAGPKEETSKERSKKTEEPEKRKEQARESVRGEREGHIYLSDRKKSVEDLMRSAQTAGVPIDFEKANKYFDSCIDWSSHSSEFRSIQQGAHHFESSDEEKFKEEAIAIEEIFKFCPVYKDKKTKDKVYRGIALDSRDYKKEEILDLFKEGNVVDMKGTSSWTSERKLARRFSRGIGADTDIRGDRISILFESANKSGISLTNMSFHSSENEVLHSSKTKWKVKDLVSTGENKYKIILDEM